MMNLTITTPLFNRTHLIQFVKQGLLCFLIISGAVSCKKRENVPVITEDTTATIQKVLFPRPSYNPSGLDTTKLFSAVPVVNNLERTDLIEISGGEQNKSRNIVYS